MDCIGILKKVLEEHIGNNRDHRVISSQQFSPFLTKISLWKTLLTGNITGCRCYADSRTTNGQKKRMAIFLENGHGHSLTIMTNGHGHSLTTTANGRGHSLTTSANGHGYSPTPSANGHCCSVFFK